nr:T9SS sorting signal type C domain-containing protein [uncultured Flavobacterium sp.]
MIKKLLLTIFLLLVQTAVLAQTLGDYRSNVTSGNWTTLTSWQYYNGTSWVTPSGTSPQGYPGQFAGTYAVLIQTGHTITMGTADLTTATMGTVTISGALVLDGGSGAGAGGTFTINTQNLIVTPGLTPAANINFANKVTLNLPTNVSIQVGAGGLPTPGNGTCNNNIEISIGGNVLAYCTGTGSPAAAYTFTDVINNGGYNVVKAVLSKTSLCGSSSFSINGTATPSSGATIKWYTVPSGGTSIHTGTTYSSAISSATTYYVEASYTGANAYTTSRTAVVVTVDSVPTNTWNGSAWSTGSVPTSSEKIIFAGNYSSSSDLVACSCQVNSGAVVINSDHTLTLTNEVAVSGGSLTFENNSSLVQINNTVVNTGVITYKRNNTTTRETDYTYWSSPVSGQTLKNASPDTLSDKYYSFDAVADDWNQEDSANVMLVGIGYIIRGPHYTSIPPPGFYEAPFNGTPNNGAFSLTGIIADKSYLIGNPYPSALDADKFLTDNNSVLDGTLYFWTHNTAIGIGVSNPGTGIYAYSSDDYASYNLTGGVGTGNFVGLDEQISNKPSGKIASGQGFFAGSNLSIPANSEIIFNNSMRVGVGGITGNNSQFFKITKNSKTTSAIEKHRVWLNLTNTQGAYKQMLVGYVTNATDGYDNSFDGESFDGNQFVDFYSVNEDKNLTIQGRVLPFKENDEVPLGYSSTIEGVFTIAIDQVDGILTSQNVFIEDKLTNVIHDLKESSYSFVTEAGIFNDRFVLRYTTNIITNKTLGTGDFETLDNTVLVSNKNKQIKINSSAEAVDKVEVYDLLGRLVYQKVNVDANEFHTSNITLNKQTIIVKVTLTNGKMISKKVIY